MSAIRTIMVVAVPAVTAIFGLLWIFGKKRPPSPRKPPDKNGRLNEHKSTSNRPETKTSSSQSVKSASPQTTAVENSAEKVPFGKSDADIEPLDSVVPKINSNISSGGDTGISSDKDKAVLEEAIIPQTEASQSSSFTPSNLQDVKSSLQFKTENRVTNASLLLNVRQQKEDNQYNTGSLEITQVPVEEVVMPCNAHPVNAASPTHDHQVTSTMSQSFNNSHESETVTDLNSQIISENKTLAETSPGKCESSVSSGDDCRNIGLEQSVNSVRQSWHESLTKQDDSNDLHSNTFGTHENDIKSNADIKEMPSNSKSENVMEQNVTNINKTDRINRTEENGTAEEDSKLSSSVAEVKPGMEQQHNQSDNAANCDNLSEASNDSGKGGSVFDNSSVSPPDEDKLFEFNIPSNMCGLFIGSHGKTIKSISQQSGTRIRIQPHPYTNKFQICIVEGTQSAIDKACSIIKRKFPSIKFPNPEMPPTTNPVIMPEIMQLSLPEGVSVDIVVSSIVDAGRIFVQQPTHPTFPSLDRLNTFMNTCYMQDGAVPDMPRPIETGVICAAPMLNGWYRAQIMSTYDALDECDIKYVDYGGYSRIASSLLKQIRSDFMTLPFEAVECYLANITPLESEAFFSTEAAVMLENLTQGKLLQAQVVGRAEDGVPFVNVFQIQPNSASLLVNREMVNRGVVRWMENM